MAVVPSAGAPLRFEVLGAVRAIRAGRELDTGPAKQRAVLAVLLLNSGHPVSTDRIVDAVWGDAPPENGANVVQKYVAGLRRVLEPDRSPRTPGELLTLTGSGYRLHLAAGTLDLDEFRAGVTRAAATRAAGRLAEAAAALRSALALWQGPAFSGQTGTAFDSARNRLADELATAWESWAELELQLGQHGTLVPHLVRLAAEFPLREGLRALLMTALYQGGRQAEALAAYRDAREFLHEEFGVEPGDRLQETHRAILRGDVALAPPTAVPPVVVPAQYQPPGVGHPPPGNPPPPPDYSARLAPMAGPPTAAWHPAPPPELPRRPRTPYLEVAFAVVIPIITFALGNFIYFCYAAIRRRTWWLIAVGLAYTVVAWTFLVIAGTDPSDPASLESTPTEDIFYPLFFIVWFGAVVHGVIVAVSADSPHHRNRREQARHFAHLQPERARHLGVGRPDLARTFDDGGLVDLNHAPAHELARLSGFDPQIAHRIVVERSQRAAFTQPNDLVSRGIISTKSLHRVASRLICLPPTMMTAPDPSPRMPPAAFGLPHTGTGPGPYRGALGTFHPGGPHTPPPDQSYPEPSDPWLESPPPN
jgi:DNA-binding SARP family transcriptional activator